MNLRTIPRAAVGGYLKLLRAPVDTTLGLLGRNGNAQPEKLAVDRAEAGALDVAATVTGDKELRQKAGRKRAATDERERAANLKAKAQQRTSAAERRKQEADKAADERKRRAAQAEKRRKTAAQKAAARAEEQISEQEKRARLKTLEEKSEAMNERDEALTASDEAQRLQDAAASVKAERKAKAKANTGG